jgi:hypothetical protein
MWLIVGAMQVVSAMQETRERFVTQWRPPTSFGYQNFDLEKHFEKEGKRRKKSVKEVDNTVQNKQFFYFSRPVAITG